MSDFERAGEILSRSTPGREAQIRKGSLQHRQAGTHPAAGHQPDVLDGEAPSRPKRGLYLLSGGKSVGTGEAELHGCPICKGTRWLRRNLPPEHPEFGKLVECACLLQQRRARQLQSMLELCTAFGFQRAKTLEMFRPQVKGVQQAVREARRVIALLQSWSGKRQDGRQTSALLAIPDRWIVFVGPVGVGKTHLAMAIGNACIDAGIVTLFATVPDLLDHLRATFAPISEILYDELFERMRNAELLILDDLGAERSSSWAQEKLFQLLNYRYNFRLPTVITMNSKGWTYLDDRLQSRLSDLSLVRMVKMEAVQDYRGRNMQRLPPGGEEAEEEREDEP